MAQLEVAMDLSSFSPDDQTQSPSPLTDSQTEDLNSFHTPVEKTLSAYETVSDLSNLSDDSLETLSNISQSLPKENSKDSDFRLTSECLPKAESPFGFPKHGLPLLPQFSYDPISPLCESFTDISLETALEASIIQQSIQNQSPEVLSSSLEGLMEQSVTDPLSIPKCSQVTGLSRSLSHGSDSLESNGAAASVSELYIFENETQDFILSPKVDPERINCPEHQPLSETELANAESGTHVLLSDSENLVTQCYNSSSEEQAIVDSESHVHHLGSPAGDACESDVKSGNDAGRGKAEVTDFTPQTYGSDSPVELWLDACQYLTGEDTGDLNKTSHSLLTDTGDWSFSPGETQVSGYYSDECEVIGWCGDDTKGWGPSVERWSSVDSWASALSDWTDIIAAPPEDFTAAFTEIGAEIDALTQALAEGHSQIDSESKGGKGQEAKVKVHSQPPMGVKDQPQNIPEGSLLSGQGCLFFSLETGGEGLRDRDASQSIESLCDSGEATELQKAPEEIQSSEAELPMGSPTDTSVISTSAYLDFCPFGGFGESAETDSLISCEEDAIILNITEDTDLEGQNAPAGIMLDQPTGSELSEVTDEHRISQPGSTDNQEPTRISGPAEVDPKGTECSTDLYSFTPHTLTNWHVPGGDIKPGVHINVPAHVSPDTSPDFDGACQLEPQGGSPKFIMPLAPLSISSSLICQKRGSLDGHQTHATKDLNYNRDLSSGHIQPSALWPTLGGITHEQSLEADKDLFDRKENTVKSSDESSADSECVFTARKAIYEDINDLSREFSNLAVVPAEHFVISEERRTAYITLDLYDPFAPRVAKPIDKDTQSRKAEVDHPTTEKMPHKARSKKDKSSSHHHGAQASKKQENLSHHVSAQHKTDTLTAEIHSSEHDPAVQDAKDTKVVIETFVENEKAPSKPHGKKKKKHAQSAPGVKGVVEPLAEVEKGAKPKSAKGRIEMFEAKLDAKAGKAQKDKRSNGEKSFQQLEAGGLSKEEQTLHHTKQQDRQTKTSPSPPNDDIIKKRRLSEDKFGKILSALESKLPKQDVSIKAKAEEAPADTGATHKKAYSEVVKQKIVPPEEVKVVKTIQAVSVSGDPQSLCLWCQFTAVFSNHTVTWSRDGTVLTEVKRSAGDESRVSVTITNASHKDLGKYQCLLTSSQGSVTLDYLLTYEVLSEIVIPPAPKSVTSAPEEVGNEEEDVHYSQLLFKEDFLSEQYFAENEPASIITEKVHFGEGMHRRAFRTKMKAGQIPLLLPGHPCVLKVHNAISYGTKNNEELVQKNFSLAVEECQVQNTAREYIKAYTSVAQSFEAFGATPEIIPIYLVHRPSNNIPYATLEEELIGDFVKYSVKDGKEINLMRRDSEAGQKCCAFQHWVYHNTEGNLLVTDMQGVGMRLTDVGIATCKKGYKGFKGNCATSFIDQFKALHQCNKYCEILGLKSLQPKPKKPAAAPKPKPQPAAAPKKKTFGPTVKSKS